MLLFHCKLRGANTVPKDKPLGKKEDLFQNLNYLLDKRKVYLNAKISLISLSKMLYTNTAYLSKVINIRYGCNLKTLLNRYRVAYAKQLLQEEECDIGRLPELCGFQLRSAFYASFSRFEGQTPTDYRSHMLSIRLRSEG